MSSQGSGRLRATVVRAHVTRDHVAAARGVGARRAAVGLLACVRALVRGQVVGAREHLAARRARVRLDAAVQARVTRQHIGARELAVAHLALVGAHALRLAAVPRRNVLHQPIIDRELLPAGVAAEEPSGFTGGLDAEVQRGVVVAGLRRVVDEPGRRGVVVVVVELDGQLVEQARQPVLLVLVDGGVRGRQRLHATCTHRRLAGARARHPELGCSPT